MTPDRLPDTFRELWAANRGAKRVRLVVLLALIAVLLVAIPVVMVVAFR